MNALKVLHLIPTLGIGGAEQLLSTILPALKERGHELQVATLWGPHDLEAKFRGAGIPVAKLDVPQRWNVPAGTLRVSRLLRRTRPDIVHTHLFFATLYGGLSKPAAGGPRRAVTFHNLAYDSYPPATAWKRVRRKLHGSLVRLAFDGRLAVSPSVAAHYREHLSCGPVGVIPNAVDLGLIEDAFGHMKTRNAEGSGTDGRIEIVSPGRLVPEKGHRFLLRALSIIRGKGLPASVTVYGAGPARQTLMDDIQALKLEGSARIHNPIPQPALFEKLLETDVVVFPSTHEGFGIGAAEAMALGRPVIASRVGGLKEIIEHERTGLLVEPGEPTQLASAIHRIASAPELGSELGRRAREYASSQFGPEAVAQQYEQFYETILGS